MKAIETPSAHPELRATQTAKNPRSVRRRRSIFLAAAGFMIPFVTSIPFIGGGLIPVSWGQWSLALAAVLGVWGLMLSLVVLGWDERLSFDPHFHLVPSAAAAVLLWMFVYLYPESRMVVLQGWFVVLLFGASVLSLKGVLALNTFMVSGYLGTLGFLGSRGEPIPWAFEIGVVVLPFFLFTLFCGTVLERLRREREEMKALQNQLAHFALTDRLTDLPNRRHFDDYRERHSALCRRSGGTYALGLIDVDHFKEINDSLGHEAGDRVLVELAEVLRSQLRQSDLAARVGGDEFAVLMVDTDAQQAKVVLDRVLRAVASHCFSVSGLRLGEVTVCIGVTASEGSEDPDDVLRRADAELYAAKSNGRNRLAVAPSPAKQIVEVSGSGRQDGSDKHQGS